MKVIVLGDIIIDQYVYGTSTRLSPEAPVPVVTQQSVKETLGGAGLVYNNLTSLGVDVDLFEYSHPKSTKTRVICDGHYITRIDSDVIMEGNDTIGLINEIDFTQYDYALLIDYDKGLLGQSVEVIQHINNTSNCKIIVDPKRAAHDYKGAWLVKPNGNEYSKFGFNNWKGNIITTNANESVSARMRDAFGDQEFTVPVENVEVSDVTGAGDCFMAAFVYGLTKGYDFQRCLELAVKGSTESVKHVGTYILTEDDLNKKVIFTNGCFDILHKGHLTLLKEARTLGDKLIVGLNSDASVKRLKGDLRPVNNIDTRREQLELIPYVDEVIVFEEDTPYELIQQIEPDLIVKGGDYTVEEIVGHDLAPVHIIPTVEGHSTTDIIEASNEILITGHEGFVGKNLAPFLDKENELFGYEWNPESLPDVSGYDWVIHLGAISSTTERDVDKVMLQNYEFSKWLFNQCNLNGVNFQYASSASVYGTNTDFNEDAPKQPQSYYATSKYLFDRWVMQQEHKIIVQGFRYFNVYGQFEDHKGDQASPITKFFKQAKTGTITLFENSDNYKRDFIYVGDCCNIHRYMLTTTEAGIFNIGTGVATSFQTIAELVAKRFNANIKYIPMPEALKGQYQEYTCADIKKLSNIVNINFTTPKEFING